MKKIANQILYNLKKEKTSFISFGVIILITALILNCAAVLLCQVDRAYDTKFEKLSTAMLNAIVPEVQNSSELEKAIDEIEKVEKIESYTAIMTEATVKDFNGADFSMNTVFYNIDDKRTLNNYELVRESKNNVDDPIYIPLYVSNFGGFALNDEIVYAIDGKSHSFTVAGVIEEMQYGNYGSGLLCAYLPKEEFAELADSYSDKAVVEYSMSVKSDASLDEVKDDVSKAIENKGVMALSILDSESVKGTRTMVTDLLVLILTAFALIILPILMLTALDDEPTQAASFDEQADDYITKPFSMLLLGKRVTALLRRCGKSPELKQIQMGDITVDFGGYTASGPGGPIDLTPKEIDLLKLLIEHKGLVLTRSQILDELWGYDYPIIDRTIDTYIKNLRKKLSLDRIVTVKGVGYKYEEHL